jgi:photosystem II stability/assembly factor-like uncharacterized protein
MKKILLFLFLSLQLSAQWQKQAVNTEASFRSIHALNDNVVWIGGTKGTFVKTTDGGKNWQTGQVPNAQNLDFRDIHALDANTALAMSAGEADKGQARIYRTTDGGSTWTLVFETQQKGVFLDGMDFWDKQNGIVFGDPIDNHFYILLTQDGGKTWTQANTETMPPVQTGEAAFAASGTSLVVQGKNNAWICTGGSKLARVFSTKDRGQHWEVAETTLPANQSSGLFGLHFWNAQKGIAVGGDYQNVKTPAPVLLTEDGGKTWTTQNTLQPEGLKEAVSLFQHKTLIAVGPSGTGYSKDFGKTWTAIDQTAFHALSVSKNNVWAVGSKGLVTKLSIKF